MPARSRLAAAACGLLLGAVALHAVAAQAPAVGCARPSLSTTTISYGTAPPLAAIPGLASTAIIANGIAAFLPEQVQVITVTNYQGVEGLTKVTVHSTITGDRLVYTIPDWLLRAYGGDTGRIIADLENGRLADVGPCF